MANYGLGWRRMATHIVEKNNRSEMLLVIRFSDELFLTNGFDQPIDGTEAY
jgi:hypothetical protein